MNQSRLYTVSEAGLSVYITVKLYCVLIDDNRIVYDDVYLATLAAFWQHVRDTKQKSLPAYARHIAVIYKFATREDAAEAVRQLDVIIRMFYGTNQT